MTRRLQKCKAYNTELKKTIQLQQKELRDQETKNADLLTEERNQGRDRAQRCLEVEREADRKLQLSKEILEQSKSQQTIWLEEKENSSGKSQLHKLSTPKTQLPSSYRPI